MNRIKPKNISRYLLLFLAGLSLQVSAQEKKVFIPEYAIPGQAFEKEYLTDSYSYYEDYANPEMIEAEIDWWTNPPTVDSGTGDFVGVPLSDGLYVLSGLALVYLIYRIIKKRKNSIYL